MIVAFGVVSCWQRLEGKRNVNQGIHNELLIGRHKYRLYWRWTPYAPSLMYMCAICTIFNVYGAWLNKPVEKWNIRGEVKTLLWRWGRQLQGSAACRDVSASYDDVSARKSNRTVSVSAHVAKCVRHVGTARGWSDVGTALRRGTGQVLPFCVTFRQSVRPEGPLKKPIFRFRLELCSRNIIRRSLRSKIGNALCGEHSLSPARPSLCLSVCDPAWATDPWVNFHEIWYSSLGNLSRKREFRENLLCGIPAVLRSK
jgi:hypothetical protein